MNLKQKYLHERGPFPFNFQQQRQSVFQKILSLISSNDPNYWLTSGYAIGSYIQMFKQVYGMTSLQKQTLISLLMNYIFVDEGISVTVSISVLNCLYKICETSIRITKNFTVNNAILLQKFRTMTQKGTKMPLKHVDAFLENYCKFVLYISKFGEDCTQQALQLSIDQKDLRFLAIFIRSLKNQESAQKIIEQIFVENSVFDRDISWFYILDYVTRQYPKIDYSRYYQTIFQQVIKSITALIDPFEEVSKRITQKDLCVGLKCILKSCAGILVNMIEPSDLPNSEYVWSCIQRIFNIIETSCDHINQTYFIYDFFMFLKTFLKSYLIRYRKQHKMYQSSNEDTLEYDQLSQMEQEQKQNRLLPLDEVAQKRFESLWENIFPKLLLFQENQCWLPKILSDLVMYKKQMFLVPILQEILKLTQKQDVSLLSFFTPKMTILYLQQFTIEQGTEQDLTLLIKCLEAFLDVIQKLGISQNLDMLELVIRIFIYLKPNQINSVPVQNLIEDINELIIENLNPMSISLQDAGEDQAQIYIDFKNIFISFFFILDERQIEQFTDKFLYKISESVPTHRQAYQFVAISLSFVNPDFAAKILKKVWKQLITPIKRVQMQAQKPYDCFSFLPDPQYTLSTSNQQNIKWLTSLVQCAYQYNPDNIVRDWQKLEVICLLLIKESQNQNFHEWGLDTLYNLILGLTNVHLQKQQFIKPQNWKYQSLNIEWKHFSKQKRQLLSKIYQKYYVLTKQYILNRYGPLSEIGFKKNQRDVLIGGQMLPGEVNSLIDGILISNPMTVEAVSQKKILSKCLSLQQTIVSSLISKLPPRGDSHLSRANNSQKIFLQEYKNLRQDCCEYLEYVINVIGQYNMLWNSSMMKIFHYFWRQAHEQASMSSSINATNDKLTPYFYPTQHKMKELFSNPFLIINEAYLLYYSRLQLNVHLFPVNYTSNPNYLIKSMVSDLLNDKLDLQNCLKTCTEIKNIHSYHRIIITLFRAKLDPEQQGGYIKKYLNNLDSNQDKQKYLTAIRYLITAIKRCQYFFGVKCCLQDQYIRYSLIHIIRAAKMLTNKKDKVSLLETFHLKLNFNIELKLIYDQKKKFSINNQKNQLSANIIDDSLIRKFKQKSKDSTILNDRMQLQSVEQVNRKQTESVVKFIQKIFQQLQQPNLNKDAALFLSIAQIYSTILDLTQPVIGKILKLSFKFCDTGVQELIDIGRTVFFHILYRFAKQKQVTRTIPNTPKKRPYQKFLYIRMLGGPQEIDYLKIKCDRLVSYFYPVNQLTETTYLKLIENNTNQESQALSNQKILLGLINNHQYMLMFFRACTTDNDLKNHSEVQNVLADDQPKGIMTNAHKLANFIYDSNPQKIDIFMTFIENFSTYSVSFYPRMIQKMVRLGNAQTIANLKQISKELKQRPQLQYQKISLYIASEIIASLLDDKQFIEEYLEYISKCSNQIFSFALECLYFLFCTNFLISANIYKSLIERLREQKGSSRFRHLEVFNIYVLAQGRFARNQAKDTIGYLLKGIEQGTNEIAQAIVSMIVSCFVIAINLDVFQSWVQQPLYKLIEEKRIYRLNERVGFEIDGSLKNIINQITIKATSETDMMSNNLKTYTKIANQILGNITVHRFNDTFYDVLKGLIMYVINKPGDNENKSQLISQLKDSQYPQHIYQDLIKNLLDMQGNTPSVVKKKLMYIQGITINRSFVTNRVEIPDILTPMNQKNITLEHITTISNMARLMRTSELCEAVQKALKMPQKDKTKEGFLMAYLQAAGVKAYDWKQAALKEILKSKKKKLVKQFIHAWWKGKGERNQQEERLEKLIKNVETPYNYFA